MKRWLARAEGVNFSATVDDTNDLSTIRGGSLALLRLHEAVEGALRRSNVGDARLVFSGASKCAFTFAAEGTEEEVDARVRAAVVAYQRDNPGGAGSPPFGQLTLVVDTVPLEGEAVSVALKKAEARNHARQFRSWTLTGVPVGGATRADRFDGVRPATVSVRLPAGKLLTSADGPEEVALAPTVARRRAFGREARQAFYWNEIAEADTILGPRGSGLTFTDSVQDLVADSERLVTSKGLPESLRGKIALVYADGNGFGAARAKVGVEAFAATLKPLRDALLADMVRWFAQGAKGDEREAFAVEDDPRLGLRLETLLWGGDELLFAMPAWLAFAFVGRVFSATRTWNVGGPLTHAVGVAVAGAKTPIRQLRRVAKQVADAAKDAGLRHVNSVGFEIYESLAPPDLEIAGARERTYGPDKGLAAPPDLEIAGARARTCGPDKGHKGLAAKLAISGDEYGRFMEGMARLTGADGTEGFPRSQIHAALRAARAAALHLLSDEAERAVRGHLDRYETRAGGAAQVRLLEENLPPGDRPLAVSLALIAQFWDYAHPLEGSLLPFGSVERGAA